MGISLVLPDDRSIPGQAGHRDAMINAGTIVFMDFGRVGAWDGAGVDNLAAENAQALAGDPCHATAIGKLANIRQSNGWLGFGAEGARLRFPVALTDYWAAQGNIACALAYRTINGPITPWAANTFFAAGTVLVSGYEVYTVTVGGITGAAAPTHTAGTAANGAATLVWGVAHTSTPNYGAYDGPIAYIDDAAGAFAAESSVVGMAFNRYQGTPAFLAHQAHTGYGNTAVFGPTSNYLNAESWAEGLDVNAVGRHLYLGADNPGSGYLYNATAGEASQNLAGLHVDVAAIMIENLGVSGRTLAQVDGAFRSYLHRYSAARGVLA